MAEIIEADPHIAANLAAVNLRIADLVKEADRPAGSVTLVAVSKMHPAASAEIALDAGHKVFGENRVQEALGKWPGLRQKYPDLQLHLIGPLQTNKVRDVIGLFDVIETIDRPKLARAVAAEMARTGLRPTCFVQVNTGEEPQKAGILPAEADGFITFCRQELDLPVEGLMCIPPVDEAPALHFALLHEMAKRNGLASLSMGMSADFDVAIRLGATHVRVGTAIFGQRPS
jgi:pyridoxal phosphate enzyme (YggS family)